MVLSQIWVRSMEKEDIRRQIFGARKACSQTFVEEQSALLCEKIFAMPQFEEADCIYVYMDYNKEASTRPIVKKAWEMVKRVAAPKVFGDEMRYFYIDSYQNVAPGYFGIPEPVVEAGLGEANEEDALLLVPGVAFDRECHRCGYGKGFYDRYLDRHPRHTTVALALDFQIVESVPGEAFDIRPWQVVTPTANYCRDEMD